MVTSVFWRLSWPPVYPNMHYKNIPVILGSELSTPISPALLPMTHVMGLSWLFSFSVILWFGPTRKYVPSLFAAHDAIIFYVFECSNDLPCRRIQTCSIDGTKYYAVYLKQRCRHSQYNVCLAEKTFWRRFGSKARSHWWAAARGQQRCRNWPKTKLLSTDSPRMLPMVG